MLVLCINIAWPSVYSAGNVTYFVVLCCQLYYVRTICIHVDMSFVLCRISSLQSEV